MPPNFETAKPIIYAIMSAVDELIEENPFLTAAQLSNYITHASNVAKAYYTKKEEESTQCLSHNPG